MSLAPPVMRRIMRELSELQNSPPEGIRVSTSEGNMLDVTGIIQGPEGTPYAGGYFRVKFRFTEEFPAAPPKCWLATKIFHPNVSQAGEICVNTLKKDWNASYGIGHILATVKCLLIYPNPDSALDEEAGKLLQENYESYCDRARLITSVHATPRVRPVEFEDVPEDSSAASSSTTAAAVALTSTKLAAAAAVLSTSAQKCSPTTKKERLTSPSPLSTADSNLGVPAGVQTSTDGLDAVAAPSKAVKRAAAPAATGAEKRKKALKRL